MFRASALSIVLALLALAGAAPAHAEVREGTATDAIGDGSPLDVSSMRVTYDSNGQLRVFVTFEQPISSVAPFFILAELGSKTGTKSCGGVGLKISAVSDDPTALWSFSRANRGEGNYFALDDKTVAMSATSDDLRGYQFECATMFVSNKDGEFQTWDQMGGIVDGAGLWFDGYGPPKCPTKLKGKTLAQARAAINAVEGCSVNLITGPKTAPKAKKGRKRKTVVVKSAELAYDPAKVNLTTKIK